MRKSFIIGLGLICLVALASLAGQLAFASDPMPSPEPAGSPYFEATLQQAVDELDGKAQPAAARGSAGVAYQPAYTSDANAGSVCFTRDLAYWPRCHYTTDAQQWPDYCTPPYQTEDYTWDSQVWQDCQTPVTVDPNAAWCDPVWTSNPDAFTCNPSYTLDSGLWPWCEVLYTWDTARWDECPKQPPYYTQDPDQFAGCASWEYTTDPERWGWCHFTSDALEYPACQTKYPTQDYTSNPAAWYWCPGPGYTTNPQQWPWCDPAFTVDATGACQKTYTQDPIQWQWCQGELYTQEPAMVGVCHYTSDPVKWPQECGIPYATKDYTEDLNLWPACRELTSNPDVWPRCHPDYTRDPAAWPWCDPKWTWDATIWPQCAAGYTYTPGTVPCGQMPYTESPTLWPECGYETIDSRIWPECHYTSDPKLATCLQQPPVATKDYTTDPRLWTECGPELGDLGDAPDSTNHAVVAMTAYPGPGVQGQFPTVFDAATGLPQGPKHWRPRDDAWLGPGVTVELDADQLPDGDGLANLDPPLDLPDRDNRDDGVKVPLALPPCVPTTMTYTVTITPGSPLIDRFVNVWFDWNRDGDWGDAPPCSATGGPPLAPEWAVQNQVIPAALAPGTYVLTTPAFLPWHPAGAALPMLWMRISIAERPVGNNLPPDGRGPTPGYRFGETEDYVFEPGCPVPVADFVWDPVTPCTNSPVQFWDASTGALTWQWDFDGLGTSNAQNPSFTFTSPGTYDVNLTVTNACGSDTVTKTVTVNDCSQQNYDIWLKDNDLDTGAVPVAPEWWISPDIWVRHDGDCANTTHQNPIPGLSTTVCIRVRNRLTTPVANITVNAYYANAALALVWPGSWSYLGSFVIPNLAGLATTVQSVPWNVPATTGHFCLLARADAAQDPLPVGPDTVAPVDDPPNNNNIAQKNTSIVDRAPRVQACGFYSTTLVTQRFEFDVVNTWAVPIAADVQLSSSDYPAGASLTLRPPNTLWGLWTGLEHLKLTTPTLELEGGMPAAVRGLPLAPSMVARMVMTITARIDQKFSIDVSQIVSNTVVGGIQYVRDIPLCFYLPLITKP